MAPARVVMEVGTHPAWAREAVAGCGHEVLVANPRQMEGPKRRKRKNDRIDAHKLARVGRMDPQSLFPVDHRSAEVRQDLVAIRARDALVAVRTELINTTRGLVKSVSKKARYKILHQRVGYGRQPRLISALRSNRASRVLMVMLIVGARQRVVAAIDFPFEPIWGATG